LRRSEDRPSDHGRFEIAQAAKSDPTASAADIFRRLADDARAGRRGVLATITGLTGTGARAVGTHMAIFEGGESAGSFSSGCVESAIVAEAAGVLAACRPRTVRFGQGSPYIDIRLPCGGGMDVLFLPDPSLDRLERIAGFFSSRTAFTLYVDEQEGLAAEPGWDSRPRRDRGFAVHHAPPLKLILLGHGAEMLAGLRLARAHGADVEIVSPEEDILRAALAAAVPASRLLSPDSPVELRADAWTAMLFLFHDHDWEPDLLARALATPAFWIGAMGSERTQAARRAALAGHGVDAEAIARVRGPVGLIRSSRDPSTLALSALAEIVDQYRLTLP
jgi:xanthine dehydrogenase accessory factor